MTSLFKRLIPTLNRIVIKKVEVQAKSKSGIILQQAVDKGAFGEVVSTGPGSYDLNGKLIPLVVKVGDVVLLPEFGGAKINLKDGEFFIYRDSDVIGTLHKD